MLAYITATSSPTVAQALLAPQDIQPTYRIEFNPLSGRWMVLSIHDECMQAGLSKAAAIAYAEKLNNN